MDNGRIYRRATLQDKEGVLLLAPNLYSGRDYLPYLYDSVIDKDRGYVCEENGKIVAFGMINIVDNGETAVRRGGRVLVSHQGQGIFRDLSNYMTSDLYTIPSVKYSAMSVNGQLFEKSADYIKRENYILKMKINFILVSYDITEVMCSDFKPRENITVCDVDRICLTTILKSKSTCDYLFPEGYIRIHCVPFRPEVNNMDFFISNQRYLVGSFNKNDTSPDNIRLLTIASYFPCKAGLAYQIDIFGDKTEDLYSHFWSHLMNIRKLTTASVTSGIMFDNNMKFDQIKAVLKECGIFSETKEMLVHTFIKTLC